MLGDAELLDLFHPFFRHPIVPGLGFAWVIGNGNLVDPPTILEQRLDHIALIRLVLGVIHTDFVQF